RVPIPCLGCLCRAPPTAPGIASGGWTLQIASSGASWGSRSATRWGPRSSSYVPSTSPARCRRSSCRGWACPQGPRRTTRRWRGTSCARFPNAGASTPGTSSSATSSGSCPIRPTSGRSRGGCSCAWPAARRRSTPPEPFGRSADPRCRPATVRSCTVRPSGSPPGCPRSPISTSGAERPWWPSPSRSRGSFGARGGRTRSGPPSMPSGTARAARSSSTWSTWRVAPDRSTARTRGSVCSRPGSGCRRSFGARTTSGGSGAWSRSAAIRIRTVRSPERFSGHSSVRRGCPPHGSGGCGTGTPSAQRPRRSSRSPPWVPSRAPPRGSPRTPLALLRAAVVGSGLPLGVLVPRALPLREPAPVLLLLGSVTSSRRASATGPIPPDELVGRGVVVQVGLARGLQLRDDPARERLAELHAPLVERVDVPDGSLGEDLVLIERDQPPQGPRIELVGQDRGRRPVAREGPVRNQRLRDSLGPDLVARPAERERLGLGEQVGHQQVVVAADHVRRPDEPDQVARDQLGPLVQELEVGVLPVGPLGSPDHRARLIRDELAVQIDRLAVR